MNKHKNMTAVQAQAPIGEVVCQPDEVSVITNPAYQAKKRTRRKRKDAVAMVMESWERLKLIPNVAVVVGKLVFGKFFEIAPHAMDLYPFLCGSKEELFQDEAFKAHSVQVVETLDLVVTSLRELDREVIVDLGVRHTRYPGVSPAFFIPLGKALLYALETGLKDIWDKHLKIAWLEIITFVANAMTEGMEKGQQEAKQSKQMGTKSLVDSLQPQSDVEDPTASETETSTELRIIDEDELDQHQRVVLLQRKDLIEKALQNAESNDGSSMLRPKISGEEEELLVESWGILMRCTNPQELQRSAFEKFSAVVNTQYSNRDLRNCQMASMIGQLIENMTDTAFHEILALGRKHIGDKHFIRDLPLFSHFWLVAIKEKLQQEEYWNTTRGNWNATIQSIWIKFMDSIVHAMTKGMLSKSNTIPSHSSSSQSKIDDQRKPGFGVQVAI